jgi:hypothetical protein
VSKRDKYKGIGPKMFLANLILKIYKSSVVDMGEFVCSAISLFLFSDEENVILHQIRKVQRTFARQKKSAEI